MELFTDLANRLKKVAKHRRSWAKRMRTDAYRIYEMDIPGVRYIVDRYGDHVVVYDKRSRLDLERDGDDNHTAGPTSDGDVEDSVDHSPHDQALIAAAAAALNVPTSNIHLKRRRRMAGLQQYEKLATAGIKTIVQEETSRYIVNLSDYLDTGLFLDHRPMRTEIRRLPPGKRFLNLFCYTGSVTVAAAQSGALTTSVDMSNTYIDWAEDNLKLNELPLKDHELVREDALRFLEAGPGRRPLYDVVFLDPPTFSNSKRMRQSFDVQRDHAQLIRDAMAFVAPGGTLYFSTNRQRFVLDDIVSERLHVEEISARTVPDDFRDKKIHRCFVLSRRP